MAKEVAKPAKKAAAPKDDGKTILAYNVKAKEKQAMVDPVISKTEKGGYIAKGTNEDGDKLTAILSKEKAEKYVKDGVATKDKKTWK